MGNSGQSRHTRCFLFRGFSTLNLDAKDRLALPRKYRDLVAECCANRLILTFSPRDPCLFLYPLPEWTVIEAKLMGLSDFVEAERTTKRMMLGHAEECHLDAQGRLRILPPAKKQAGLEKHVAIAGVANKFEIWDEATWHRESDEWKKQVDRKDTPHSDTLQRMAL